jgi:predicted ATPase
MRCSRPGRALAEAGAQLYHITLPPLGLEHLTHLVQDALHGDLAEARPLAALLQSKTDGNPFFVIQFLKMLRKVSANPVPPS